MAYPEYKGVKAWPITGSGEACVIFSTAGEDGWRGPKNRKITIHDGRRTVTFTNLAAYELATIFVEMLHAYDWPDSYEYYRVGENRDD